MTVLIPEVAAGGAEAGVAAETAAEGYGGTRARSRAAKRAREAAQATPGYYAGQAKGLQSARLTPGSRNYQGVILAEFLTAVLIVAFTPLATGGGTPTTMPAEGPEKTEKGEASGPPSPYHVNDIVQLVAIGAVYFVLALLSSGDRSGRIAAWFGGLVLLGILLRKLAKGEITTVVNNLSGKQPPESTDGGVHLV